MVAASGKTKDVATLQLTTENHSADAINAMYLKDRFGDVETDCRIRLHDWLLRIVGASAAPTFVALTCSMVFCIDSSFHEHFFQSVLPANPAG
jgi:hypothetical protein